MDKTNMNEIKIENAGHGFGEGSSSITAREISQLKRFPLGRLKQRSASITRRLVGRLKRFRPRKSNANCVDSAQTATEKANDQVETQSQNISYTSNNSPAGEFSRNSQSEQEKLVRQVFSLGPFHHKPESESEKIKSKLLSDRYGDCYCEELVNKMRADGFIISEIREWYARFQCPLIKEGYLRLKIDYGDEELGRMMVRDGLFLLQFLSLFPDADDFFPPWKRQFAVQEDVMKMDNQIPFFVLQYVLQWDTDKDANKLIYRKQENTDQVLDRILRQAWLKLSPIRYEGDSQDWRVRVPWRRNSHLLEFVYDNIISSSDIEYKYSSKWRKNKRRASPITLPVAADLRDKGVKFAPNTGLLNEIRFDGRNWTLYLPTIEMYGRTDAVLRNLVSFEDSKPEEALQPLMSYVDLMERLIDKTEDVQVLRKSGIIQCHLETNKAVADVWNGMRKQLPEKTKYEPIDNAIYDVNRFYTSKCRTMCAQFYKRYFSKPWSGISLFAACVALGLTAFQTYLAWEQVRLQRKSMHKLLSCNACNLYPVVLVSYI